MTDSMIGKALGQYQIVQLAGKGGMATVYKAFQPSLNRFVAIKVLPGYLAADEQFVARFKQEALSAAALRHPNILVIHDVGQEGGLHYIAMEFLDGRPLSDVIQQTGGLDPRRVAAILEQIASALDFAHSRGVVHRDIKPANIFLSADDHVTLVDFGIAKALSSAAGLTRSGTIVGTPEYMSPEQVDGRPLSPRSDIYSLGVVLYQMLTGYVPFGGESSTAIMMAHLTRAPVPPSQLSAFVTPAIESVVMRALTKDPSQRFAAVKEMAQAFAQAVYSGRPIPVLSATPAHVSAPTVATAAPRRAFPVWPIVVGVAVVALIALVALVLLGGNVLKSDGGFIISRLANTATSVPIAAAATSTLMPTYTPAPLTPTSSPTRRPSATPTTPPTTTSLPTATGRASTPTATRPSGPTRTPAPTATAVSTVANEPRAVTLLSPMPGTRFKSSLITFKWTGGALRPGEAFLVEIIPYQAEKKNTCMMESDYGRGGHQYSSPLTAHEWTRDIAAVPVGTFKPCAGPIDWVVHIRDASGAIVLSTPRSSFYWNPL